MKTLCVVLWAMIVLIMLQGRASAVDRESFGYELKQGFAGYWLVVAVAIPDRDRMDRVLVMGRCSARSCVAGGDNRLSGRLELTGIEIGPVAHFQSRHSMGLEVVARYPRRELLQAYMPYGRQLVLGHRASRREGGLVWVLVKDPDNWRFRRSLWRYVDKASRKGEGLVIHIP